MKTFTIKLSNDEIVVSEEDIKLGMPQWENAFNSLGDSGYSRIKAMKGSEIVLELENMPDGDLYQLAKENDKHIEYKTYHADSFTIKIRQELFKRKGLGYKQVGHLSKVQRNYLGTLGLKNKY